MDFCLQNLGRGSFFQNFPKIFTAFFTSFLQFLVGTHKIMGKGVQCMIPLHKEEALQRKN